MSRIEISVTRNSDDKVILNQGFCRNKHVLEFLVNSTDIRLQTLGSELSIGLDIEEENFDWLMEELNYAIQIVSSLVTAYIDTSLTTDLSVKFSKDLKTGAELLKEVWEKYDHDDYSFEIA